MICEFLKFHYITMILTEFYELIDKDRFDTLKLC